MLQRHTLILPLIFISSFALARPGIPQGADVLELPRVIARCEAPVEFSNDMQQVAFEISGGSPLEGWEDSDTDIELIRMGKRYEIRFNNQALAPEKLVNVSGDQRPVHLVLAREGRREHFMFMIDEKGAGELLWSTESVSTLTPCAT